MAVHLVVFSVMWAIGKTMYIVPPDRQHNTLLLADLEAQHIRREGRELPTFDIPDWKESNCIKMLVQCFQPHL